MSTDRRTVVARALHDTRDGGTAVLTGTHGPAGGVVQWISFGADGHLVDVPDPAKHHRPGLLRRLRGTAGPAPAGLDGELVRGLRRLGFTESDAGYERHVTPRETGHDQLVALIVDVLDVVIGPDADPITAETG